MAYSAKHLTLFLLISLLSTFHSHARDSQFFDKVPSTTTNVVKETQVPNKEDPLSYQELEPNFLPQNENGYSLYGHESGQLPPSTTTKIPYNAESEKPLSKYLPKNYNPVAYVTESEDIHNSNSFTEESYNTRTNNNNYGDDNFNERPQELSVTKFTGGESYSTTPNNHENYYNNGGRPNNFKPQGMSDTRLLQNGKFFYDVNSEKYSSHHPYESLKGVRARNEYNNRNIYGNNENSYEYNNKYSMEGQYQNEFQDEEDMP